jgi:hypothetical protein
MTHLTTPPASWRGPRLIDDETVAKMGHPNLEVGHPAGRLTGLTNTLVVDFAVRAEGDFTALASLSTALPQEGAICGDGGR